VWVMFAIAIFLRFTRRTPKGNGDRGVLPREKDVSDLALHAPNAERQWRRITQGPRPGDGMDPGASRAERRKAMETGAASSYSGSETQGRFTRRTPKGNGDSARASRSTTRASRASRAERRKAMETCPYRAAERECSGRFTRRTPKGNGDTVAAKQRDQALGTWRFTRRTPKGNGDGYAGPHSGGKTQGALHAPNAERQWRPERQRGIDPRKQNALHAPNAERQWRRGGRLGDSIPFVD